MKKSVFAIALMASLLAGAAEDSYLYWMVNVEEGGWTYDYSVQVIGKTSNNEAGSILNLYYGDWTSAGQSIGKDALQAYEGSGLGFYAKLASDTTYTSYVFELLSDTKSVVDTATFTDVQACITGSGISAPSLQMLQMQMALPAPEPSSGLLLLLGVAGLALRRRKQVAA